MQADFTHLFRLNMCVCVYTCFLGWVTELVYIWPSKCHGGWEYKLGQHIKSSVILERLYSGHRSLAELSSIFSLFTAAHAKPRLHPNKPLACCYLLPKGKPLSLPPPGYKRLSETQKKKIAIAFLQEALCLILIRCLYYLQEIDRFLAGFTSCLPTVCASVCVASVVGVGWEKNRGWNSLSLKSHFKSSSFSERIRVV